MNFEEHDAEIIACRKCPRLVEWREEVARTKRRAYRDWDYWGKPVPGFGDPKARVMIVGLAPGAHGSNRTGRMFTGDASGNFLFDALYRAGFASQPVATTRDDDLTLSDLFITAVARCVPPGNKPSRLELENCQPYLERELEMIQPQVLVPLGRIAFERLRRIYSIPASALDFAHGAIYRMENGPWLVCSYHPSQQNTQTGRLTREMFDQIWAKVKSILK
jgi:uracil-DNA glycosylase family 4